jgi:carbon monoxide dehydrogenase subunit G
MRISAKQDVEASLAQVWAILSDFDGWERAALRRGAEVTRNDSHRRVTLGSEWSLRFIHRGRSRSVQLGLTRLDPPHHIELHLRSAAIEGDLRIELIEMAARRTRLHVVTDLKPLNLGARLYLQSLRLARNRVERKYHDRIAFLAREIEQRAAPRPGDARR